MNEHKAVPNIRFNGFEDVWKSMKFKNILNYERPDKYIVKSDNYSNNGIPVLTANKSFILGYTLESSFYEKPLPIIIFDDFTLDCKLVKFPFKIKSSAIKILSSNNFSDIWFDFYLLKATSFIKEGHARHYISIVQNKKINVPDKQEQQKIGNFFAKLDKLLDLQQQKIDKLELLKKALLQKLFPKHDAKIPEFRFKGFEGDWRSCDLGKIAKLYQPKTITQKQMTSEGYPVFGANGFIGFYGKKNHSTDQVTISARGENAGVTSYVFAPVWITGNSMVINVDKNADIDKHFLFFDLSLINLKKFVTGGAQPQLTGETLRRVKIIVTKIKEQQKIGNLLSKVDQLIELENRKLQNFQQIKKCLLQNMFVE